MDYVTPENKQSDMPSYRIDTTSDGFKMDIIIDMIDYYADRISSIQRTHAMINSLVHKTFDLYDPSVVDKKKVKKLKWRLFLIDGDVENYSDIGQTIRLNSYLKYLYAKENDDHLTHVLQHYRTPDSFLHEHFTYDLDHTFSDEHGKFQFGVLKGTLTRFFNESYYKDYLSGKKSLNQLRNRLNKATQMFADRVYVEEDVVHLMCWLDGIIEDFNVDNINKVLEDMHMHVNNLIEKTWRGTDYGD